MTFRFKKEAWDKAHDFDTSYAFITPWLNQQSKWVSFNKKATQIIEHPGHLEVRVAKWYIDINHPKYGDACQDRFDICRELQKKYEESNK